MKTGLQLSMERPGLDLGFQSISDNSKSAATEFSPGVVVGQFLAQITLDLNGSASSPEAQSAQALLDKLNLSKEKNLETAFQNLPSFQKDILEKKLGVRLGQLLQVADQDCSEIFEADLLSLGQDALTHNDDALATRIFEYLINPPQNIYFPISQSIRDRAQTQYNAIVGVGDTGMRLQYLGRHILNRLAEPGMIAGMGVAEVVAGAITVRALGWFAAQSASFWTRGFVANSAAAVAAFPAEALSFWGVNRGVNQLLHPELQSWDKKVLVDELISLSSGLAFLKIGGAVTQGIFDLAHGFNPVTGDIARLSALARVTRPFARQLGMFNGIAVGQYVDNKYGAAPKLSNDTFWANTFSTLLDFNLAGHFSHALLGTRHADLMQKMAFLTQKTKMRNGGSLLQKFLLPGFRAVTPEGIEFRIEDEKSSAAAENSFQMANGAERGNGKKRRGISLTPARERARVAHTLEGLLRTYRSGDLHLSEKSKFGSGLFPDIDKVEEVLHQMVRKDRKLEPDPKKRLTKDDVAGVLQSIRMRYFESISDKLLDFSEKFNFLRNALKEKLQTSSEEERDEVISLLDSVELKYLEATRYFHAAENYLGDNKGPTEDSFFSKSKFGKLLDNFNFHNLRFTQFLERKPILRELLAAYEGKITPRYNNPIDRQMILEDLLALEQKGVPSDLTLPLKEIFETIDSSVITAELSPFSELFRFLTGEINTDDFFARYQPLQDYLEVLVELRTHLSSKMIDELSLFPWQIREDFPHIQEVAKKDLLTELVGKIPVDQAEAFVDRYFVTCNELSQILAFFRPPERNVMIPWPEVKSHLLRVQERGILKPETVAKLLDWSEGTEEQPHHGVIFGIRSEMVAGIIDFIMKDPLSPEARKEVVDFLDEVARRDDLRMMEVLAFRFQGYHRGVMQEKPSADSSVIKTASVAHTRFIKTIRTVAQFYLENPQVSGPYFEIVAKVLSGKQDIMAKLAAPVFYQTLRVLGKINTKIYRSRFPANPWTPVKQINLISRGGEGEAVLELIDSNDSRVMMGVTSILHSVHSRVDFEKWLDSVGNTLSHDPKGLPENGAKVNRIISVHVFNIGTEVSKRQLFQWATDYLETHSDITEIHLQLPAQDRATQQKREGNESRQQKEDPRDPFNIDKYDYGMVTRNSIEESTQTMINNLEEQIRDKPDKILPRLDLYRLRRSFYSKDEIHSEDWKLLVETCNLFPDNNVAITEMQHAQKIVHRDLNRGLFQLRDIKTIAYRDIQRLIDYYQTSQEGAEPSLMVSQLVESLQKVLEFLDEGHHFGVPQKLWQETRIEAKKVITFLESLKNEDLMISDSSSSVKVSVIETQRMLRELLAIDLDITLDRTAEFFNSVLGTSLPPERFERLIDLAPSEFRIKNPTLEFEKQVITLRGEIHPPKAIHETLLSKVKEIRDKAACLRKEAERLLKMEAEYRIEANDKKREGKLKEAERLRRRAKYNRNKAERLSSEVDGLEGNANHIDTEGYFRFVFGQDLNTGVLYANLGQIIIPAYVRRMGAATLFFAEYVRLCQEMKVPLIFANRATGMHAYWGMQFLEANEKSKVTLLFRDYLGKYVTGSPDLSTMSTIENPQQIADAYLDPETGSLVVPADVLQEDPNSLFIQLHHSDYQVGKEFMWDEDLEWKAVFDTDPNSISSRILGRSLQKVLNRLYPYTSRETN